MHLSRYSPIIRFVFKGQLFIGVAIFVMFLNGCTRQFPAPLIYGNAKKGDTRGFARVTSESSKLPFEAIKPGIYIVKRNENLYGVSRRSGIGLRELIDINKLSAPFHLKLGQKLRIPALQFHTVKSGETLYGISRKFGIPSNILVQINGIDPPYNIEIGQRLRLQLGKEMSKPPFQEASLPSTPIPNKKPPHNEKKGKGIYHSLGQKFFWPVRGKILSRFGAKKGGLHNDGINISVKINESIRAADTGTVAYAGNELKGYGYLVLLKHKGGWITAYAHANSLVVRVGQFVNRGQVIARAGGTGNVDRPQLHFEIRRGKTAVNPLKFLRQKQKS